MSRDTKGIIGFTTLSLLLGIIVMPFMILREWYQWKYQNTTNFDFEWEDVMLYGIYIIVGSMFHWCICDNLGFPAWTWF